LSQECDDADRIPDLLDAAQDVYHRAAEVVHRRDFWHPSKETDREEFRSEICGILFDRRLATAQDVEKLAGRLVEGTEAGRGPLRRPRPGRRVPGAAPRGGPGILGP